MKKLINGFAIIFFLAPIFAYAAHWNYTCTDFTSIGGGANCTGVATVTLDGSGNAHAADYPVPVNVYNIGSTYYFSATVTGTGAGFCLDNNAVSGTFQSLSSGVVVDQSFIADGIGPNVGIFVSDAGYGGCTTSGSPSGLSSTVTDVCISDSLGECASPIPHPSTSIDAAVAMATSSFATTFGFDMDGVSTWMWDNLGQPILGSGIGTLYVMRYYWLGFIAISIIVLFAFAYFRFFKR